MPYKCDDLKRIRDISKLCKQCAVRIDYRQYNLREINTILLAPKKNTK